jgi:WD40 repeat protein
MPRVSSQPELVPQGSVELPDCISAIRFSPDGTTLAAASLGGAVVAIDCETTEVRHRLPGHPGGALAVAWSPDGQLLATGGQDGKVRLLGLASGFEVGLDAGPGWVEHLAWSPDGRWLASSAGKVVRFWSPPRVLAGEVNGFESTVTGLVWVPESGLAVVSCYGGVHVLEVGVTRPVRSFAWKGSILSLVISPDGNYLASGNQDASVHIWRAQTGEDFQMQGYPTKVKALAFSPDSRCLATGGGAAIAIWDFSGDGPAGRAPDILEGHTDLVTDLAFVERGRERLLASVSLDETLSLWRLAKRKRGIWASSQPLARLAIDSTHRRIAVGSRLGRVSVLSAE